MARKASQYKVPQDLSCKLIYFHDISENMPHNQHILNNKMILTAQDDKESDFVYGYVLNEPAQETLRQFMKRNDVTLSEQFNFTQIMFGEVKDFKPIETSFLNFITTKDCPVKHPGRQNFGPFAAIPCETAEEAGEVARLLKANGGTIVVYSELLIPRDQLANLIRSAKAMVREPDPDVVFNRSAYMRQQLSFPELNKGDGPG